MIALIYTPEHSQTAEHIRQDLTSAGLQVTDEITGEGDAPVIVLLSQRAVKERSLVTSIERALDAYRHVIPVKMENVDLPKIINNLPFVDFSSGYNINALRERIDILTAPDIKPPLTALTTSKRQANRQSALIWGVVVVFIFAVAIFGVIAEITVPPADEFAGVETQIVLTRSYFVDQAMPVSTEQAAEFELTVEQVATAVRDHLVATATAVAGGVESTYIPRSTEQAAEFEATLKVISTVVQDRLAATVTQNALTAAAVTATPAP